MDRMNDEYYMGLALELAAKAKGQTGINPVVGCVIVKAGRIVGVGTHLKRGTGHAEVHALAMAGSEAEGATVYVTLEPCSHHGLTPPCCERIIEAKAARVVIAMVDPNPKVSGRGVSRLRDQGIDVQTGILESEARRLNEAFIKYIVTGMPFVTLKTASTLDGKIAAKTGDSQWVTGPAARELVHTLRHQHEGIMVGVSTVLADDPKLTTRLPVPGLHPVRIIADSRLRIPLSSQLLHDDAAETFILTTEQADNVRVNALEAAGAKVLFCGAGEHVDLQLALKKMAELEIGSILLEGGGRLNGAMLEAQLVDKMVLFFAPKIIGGAAAPVSFSLEGWDRMADAVRLERMQVEQAGEDLCITGYPVYPARS
ncbi:bifunctional diaminohydroxyphosphoribosylaminopyrimidine deaminase/5-amino-6-(5-phosphoribosylamino)uracil reductase RibD [Paenibacillus pinihumi]|uniref:bifunctional diaminohydroxyphosphoribosylaminopyrimidine deaminase/5-amino-6-(5-phosphoribosylamino)uracil reductase RibD n=1 Tax=Paenibacillus pinihumi TaxID=669462 RepID=UPI00048E045F|nr:bifunctional diaminohydroxyphosphoribosylaminopyrimidine deaminase/5-amino-6-(5-phosphoribosylamino)uracil reductase RibD [Paenibacillus pinihumi]